MLNKSFLKKLFSACFAFKFLSKAKARNIDFVFWILLIMRIKCLMQSLKILCFKKFTSLSIHLYRERSWVCFTPHYSNWRLYHIQRSDLPWLCHCQRSQEWGGDLPQHGRPQRTVPECNSCGSVCTRHCGWNSQVKRHRQYYNRATSWESLYSEFGNQVWLKSACSASEAS